MSIELYAWDTPNGRKISVALEEMGLPYTVHPVNIGKGEQQAPAFLKISPNGRIPAIVDSEGPGNEIISVFESGAILLYLGEKTGKFLPADQRKRIAVYEWLMWQMGGFGPMPGQVHHFIALSNEQDRAYGLARYSRKHTGSTACSTCACAIMSLSRARSRSPTSPSSAGPGATSATRCRSTIIPTSAAGTRR